MFNLFKKLTESRSAIMDMVKLANDLLAQKLSEPVVKKCPCCNREYRNALDIEAIENIGECLLCEHLREECEDDDSQLELRELFDNYEGKVD